MKREILRTIKRLSQTSLRRNLQDKMNQYSSDIFFIKTVSNHPPHRPQPKSTMKAVLFLLIVVGISIIQSNPGIQIRLPRKPNPFQKIGNFKHQVGQLLHGKVNRGRSKLTGFKHGKVSKTNNVVNRLQGKLHSKKNLFQNKIHTIGQAIRSAVNSFKNKF